MEFVERVTNWARVRPLQSLVVILVILAIPIVIAVNAGSTDVVRIEETATSTKRVQVTTSQVFVGDQSLSLLGNVRAASEAKVTSERSGRVTAVNVSLGEKVAAGSVIARLDSASEQAAVLQAEGAYEAALAAAAQSTVGVDQARTTLLTAQNSAIATLQASYNTTNGVVLNTIDEFFANPNSAVPGLRIRGQGNTQQLNNERVAYQTLLPEWQTRVNSATVSSDLAGELAYAKINVERTIDLLDTFIFLFEQDGTRYTDAELEAFTVAFTADRATLIGVQSSIDTAVSSLTSAKEALTRAQLAGTGGVTSTADAQVKQALGSLRAAQANYNKTVLRTPISGTVNALTIRPGDFISAQAQVAVVANNGAFEIITYVSDREKDMLIVGDEVAIDGSYTGVVMQISPAIDQATGKREVRIAADNDKLSNGDTVTVTKDVEGSTLSQVVVPISAVQFELENGYVFVVEGNKLVERPVELGLVRGDRVEILSGLMATEEFVADARGLRAGTEVETIR